MEELECPCCGQVRMDNEFMGKVVRLRKASRIPMPVTSGYRCPQYNATISDTGLDGPHTTGRAIDINLYGEILWRFMNYLNHAGITGIGLHQTGPYHGRFIHIDDLENKADRRRPWLWTY